MKNILPWLCVVGVSAGAVGLYLSNSAKDAELTKLREQAQQAETLRVELEETKTQAQAQSQQLGTLRKDTEELLRLRNEVRQLRDDKQQLSKQAQTAQAEAQRAQAQAAETRLSAEQQLQQVRQAQQQPAQPSSATSATAQLNSCINNLRQLDGAKQQWALENRKTAEVIPNPQDLAPYLRDQTIPTCPASGQYTLGAVSTPPACSVPGHALPPQ